MMFWGPEHHFDFGAVGGQITSKKKNPGSKKRKADDFRVDDEFDEEDDHDAAGDGKLIN